jgi:hypothetical protein
MLSIITESWLENLTSASPIITPADAAFKIGRVVFKFVLIPYIGIVIPANDEKNNTNIAAIRKLTVSSTIFLKIFCII